MALSLMRIVYLDDDAEYAMLFKACMRRAGHVVDTYLDPRLALSALDGAVQAFVTDYHLPGDDGVAVLARARAARDTMRYGLISSDHVVLAALDDDRMPPGCVIAPKPGSYEEFVELAKRLSA